MLRGRYQEASEAFTAAATVAEGNYTIAKIKGQLGELDFKRGDMANAARAYEEALRLLGKPIPQKVFPMALTLLREAAVQVTHTVLSKSSPAGRSGCRRRQRCCAFN